MSKLQAPVNNRRADCQSNATYFANQPCGAGAFAPPPALESPLRGESIPAGEFCDEFAVIQRQKCQLRSERKLGRKAEALPHRR
jgi:hypothetical protein